MSLSGAPNRAHRQLLGTLVLAFAAFAGGATVVSADESGISFDSAIVFSIAVQCGADVETIRRALCRDSQGRASGPLGAALDLLGGER